MVCSLWSWSNPECISEAFIPALLSVVLISLTLFILDAKINTWLRSLPFALKISLTKFTFWLSWHMYADCVIPSAGFEIAKLMLSGFLSNLLASSLIFGGIVAENKRVCLFFGRVFEIFMMSS